jgi:hypothetical protein
MPPLQTTHRIVGEGHGPEAPPPLRQGQPLRIVDRITGHASRRIWQHRATSPEVEPIDPETVADMVLKVRRDFLERVKGIEPSS